jgi:hypothetical protein
MCVLYVLKFFMRFKWRREKMSKIGEEKAKKEKQFLAIG